MSFRREKYVPNGGPDGGDGGHGGSVILVVDHNESNLSRYRDRRRFHASDGRQGSGNHRSGAGGDDVEIAVPPGTLVADVTTAEVLGDLVTIGDRLVVATGGRGGRGNARFASAIRQAPRLGELGEPGSERSIRLELKLIADIGLVGLPNAGKSTLLAAVTGARPKIAAYPFTTLHPNLGVAELGDSRTLVLADIPGLVEGAHEGVGLGIEFLRHLERTRVLIHVVDCSGGAAAARSAVAQVEGELGAFSRPLAEKPTLVALNKCDIPSAADAASVLAEEFSGAMAIAAAAHQGTAALIEAAARLVAERRTAETAAAAATGDGSHRLYRHQARGEARVTRDAGGFRVTGAAVERMVSMTDMAEDEAVARLQRRLKRAGVDAALVAAGCQAGDPVRIGVVEFEYEPDL